MADRPWWDCVHDSAGARAVDRGRARRAARGCRRGLDRPVALPVRLPTSDVVVHDVLADVAVGYVRREQVLAGGLEQARAVGLWLSWNGLALTAERPPGWAAVPALASAGPAVDHNTMQVLDGVQPGLEAGAS